MSRGIRAWLALNAAELPPRAVLDLVHHFGSPEGVLGAELAEVNRVRRLMPAEAARLAEVKERDFAREVETLERLGARLVTIEDDEYPANLRQIHDPPPVLFVRGRLLPQDERAIAVVGTRRVTAYGRAVTETLARDLAARGVTVVSGLAVGADAAAHRGALAGGGRTIGVLACGIDVPYPRDTLELREEIVARGAVISEFPLGTPARASRFPARNRVVSGLALGVVVTEAPERSGALITANLAASQGRQVFAVPGSVNSEFSRGTHALLRDGARLVESVEDIFDEVAFPEGLVEEAGRSAEEGPEVAGLSSEERELLRALTLQQRHVDELIEEAQLPAARVSAGLLMLELRGLVRRLPGNMYMRVR